MLELEVKKSSGQIDKYCFEKPSVMIGRAAANDIAIDASGVSRYHATLSVEDGKIVLQDLESTNGTYVNAKQVNKCDISPSDKISIGEAVITVRLLADEKAQEEEIVFLDEIKEPPVEKVEPDAVKVEKKEPPKVEEPPKATAVPPAEPAEAGESRVKSSDNFYWESLKSFLGPVWRYIDDDSVSEIMVNGPTEIYIESKGKL